MNYEVEAYNDPASPTATARMMNDSAADSHDVVRRDAPPAAANSPAASPATSPKKPGFRSRGKKLALNAFRRIVSPKQTPKQRQLKKAQDNEINDNNDQQQARNSEASYMPLLGQLDSESEDENENDVYNNTNDLLKSSSQSNSKMNNSSKTHHSHSHSRRHHKQGHKHHHHHHHHHHEHHHHNEHGKQKENPDSMGDHVASPRLRRQKQRHPYRRVISNQSAIPVALGDSASSIIDVHEVSSEIGTKTATTTKTAKTLLDNRKNNTKPITSEAKSSNPQSPNPSQHSSSVSPNPSNHMGSSTHHSQSTASAQEVFLMAVLEDIKARKTATGELHVTMDAPDNTSHAKNEKEETMLRKSKNSAMKERKVPSKSFSHKQETKRPRRKKVKRRSSLDAKALLTPKRPPTQSKLALHQSAPVLGLSDKLNLEVDQTSQDKGHATEKHGTKSGNNSEPSNAPVATKSPHQALPKKPNKTTPTLTMLDKIITLNRLEDNSQLKDVSATTVSSHVDSSYTEGDSILLEMKEEDSLSLFRHRHQQSQSSHLDHSSGSNLQVTATLAKSHPESLQQQLETGLHQFMIRTQDNNCSNNSQQQDSPEASLEGNTAMAVHNHPDGNQTPANNAQTNNEANNNLTLSFSTVDVVTSKRGNEEAKSADSSKTRDGSCLDSLEDRKENSHNEFGIIEKIHKEGHNSNREIHYVPTLEHPLALKRRVQSCPDLIQVGRVAERPVSTSPKQQHLQLNLKDLLDNNGLLRALLNDVMNSQSAHTRSIPKEIQYRSQTPISNGRDMSIVRPTKSEEGVGMNSFSPRGRSRSRKSKTRPTIRELPVIRSPKRSKHTENSQSKLANTERAGTRHSLTRQHSDSKIQNEERIKRKSQLRTNKLFESDSQLPEVQLSLRRTDKKVLEERKPSRSRRTRQSISERRAKSRDKTQNASRRTERSTRTVPSAVAKRGPSRSAKGQQGTRERSKSNSKRLHDRHHTKVVSRDRSKSKSTSNRVDYSHKSHSMQHGRLYQSESQLNYDHDMSTRSGSRRLKLSRAGNEVKTSSSQMERQRPRQRRTQSLESIARKAEAKHPEIVLPGSRSNQRNDSEVMGRIIHKKAMDPHRAYPRTKGTERLHQSDGNIVFAPLERSRRSRSSMKQREKCNEYPGCDKSKMVGGKKSEKRKESGRNSASSQPRAANKDCERSLTRQHQSAPTGMRLKGQETSASKVLGKSRSLSAKHSSSQQVQTLPLAPLGTVKGAVKSKKMDTEKQKETSKNVRGTNKKSISERNERKVNLEGSRISHLSLSERLDRSAW